MSHLKERKEKNCLNCNAQLIATYCHICGQENIQPKESVWHLVSHFFQDITHFDGKFFSTGKLLLTRPGLLPAEYARGRRAGYLNPIRMYVFTSAFFFLIFFSFIKPAESFQSNTEYNLNSSGVLKDLGRRKSAIVAKLTKESDSVEIRELNDRLRLIEDDLDSLKINPANIRNLKTYEGGWEWGGVTKTFAGYRQYDSVQKSLPADKKDGFIKSTMNKRALIIKEKYGDDPKSISKVFFDKFFHTLPQLLFVSLPLFALLLQLLYIRRKQFYYVNHLIFTLHYYIFTFIAFLIIFSLTKIHEVVHWKIVSISRTIMWIFIFVYLYKAMRNFYGQRRAKTFIKFMALNFLFMVILMFLFSIFFFYSLFQI